MKAKIIAVIAFLGLVIAATVYAAGSVSYSIEWVPGQGMKIVTIDWTGDASDGSVPNTTIPALNGYVRRVITRPHTNSTIQPTDNYDMTLVEHLNGSFDVFDGKGANRSASANQQFIPSHYNGTMNIHPVYSTGPLTFVHTNNTIASATGQVEVVVEVPK